MSNNEGSKLNYGTLEKLFFIFIALIMSLSTYLLNNVVTLEPFIIYLSLTAIVVFICALCPLYVRMKGLLRRF